MPPKAKVDWKAPDAYTRLLAATVAAAPDGKVDYRRIATYYGRDATYDSIEGRFRVIKTQAQNLREEVERGDRKEFPKRERTTTTATKQSPKKSNGVVKKERNDDSDDDDDDDEITVPAPAPKSKSKSKTIGGRVTKSGSGAMGTGKKGEQGVLAKGIKRESIFGGDGMDYATEDGAGEDEIGDNTGELGVEEEA